MSLRIKLLIGFVAIALIAAVVGGIGVSASGGSPSPTRSFMERRLYLWLNW